MIGRLDKQAASSTLVKPEHLSMISASPRSPQKFVNTHSFPFPCLMYQHTLPKQSRVL